MQALRILTNFSSFCKNSWQGRKIARNKLHNLLVLVITQSFLNTSNNFEFPVEIAKSKSLILTSYLKHWFSNWVVFEMFSADRWYQLSQKHQGIYWWSKIPLLSFWSYEILKRMENLAKNAFSSFCSIRWKFFKQTPLFPKNSTNVLFLVLLSKMIIPEIICS